MKVRITALPGAVFLFYQNASLLTVFKRNSASSLAGNHSSRIRMTALDTRPIALPANSTIYSIRWYEHGGSVPWVAMDSYCSSNNGASQILISCQLRLATLPRNWLSTDSSLRACRWEGNRFSTDGGQTWKTSLADTLTWKTVIANGSSSGNDDSRFSQGEIIQGVTNQWKTQHRLRGMRYIDNWTHAMDMRQRRVYCRDPTSCGVMKWRTPSAYNFLLFLILAQDLVYVGPRQVNITSKCMQPTDDLPEWARNIQSYQ